jgi:cyclic-di-GMP-binding protein
MPSFDIVSEVETVELRHAVDNAVREVGTRFDFRNTEASISLDDLTVTLRSESDFQVRQLEDLFRNHCVKRQVDCSGIDMPEEPLHSGKFYSLTMTFKQGLEQSTSKEIVKKIKDSKSKVQTSIQGDKIRVTGKKRDDLQEVIALLKKSEIAQPLQFNNFRD